jgi:hypothetical protein
MVGSISATTAATACLTPETTLIIMSYHVATTNWRWLYKINWNIIVFHGSDWLIVKNSSKKNGCKMMQQMMDQRENRPNSDETTYWTFKLTIQPNIFSVRMSSRRFSIEISLSTSLPKGGANQEWFA